MITPEVSFGSGLGAETGGGLSSSSPALGRDDFLNLLLTQLRNQNPLEPISNSEFIGEMAQFSTLDAVQKLNTTMEQTLRAQQLVQGASLIGKEVEYLSGESTSRSVVQAVQVVDGQIELQTADAKVLLDQVSSIQNPDLLA